MLKKLLIAAGVFGGLLMVVLSYITAKYIDQEEILRVTQEREELREQRVELLELVAEKDSIKKELESEVINLEIEADQMRTKVDSLESTRKIAQTNVRQLRTREELENRLIEAFPDIKESMKITEVLVPNYPELKISYFSVPFRYIEAFVIYRQNSDSFEMQVSKLKELDTLQQQITLLNKEIIVLEEEKSAAFEAGYDSAYVKYEGISEKYEELLKNPPTVEFGLPQIGTIIGAAAAGILIGTQIK